MSRSSFIFDKNDKLLSKAGLPYHVQMPTDDSTNNYYLFVRGKIQQSTNRKRSRHQFEANTGETTSFVKIYWICQQCGRDKAQPCGRGIQIGEQQFILKSNHSATCPGYTEIEYFNMLARQQIIKSGGQYLDIVTSMQNPEFTSQSYCEAQGWAQLMTEYNLQSAVHRSKKLKIPKLPKNIEESLIPMDNQYSHIRTNHAGKLFFRKEGSVAHVIGKGENRCTRYPHILIFSSDFLFKALVDAKEIFMDGGHKMVPAIYKNYSQAAQVYFINIMKGGHLIPCFTAVLPGGTTPMYDFILKYIIEECQQQFNTIPKWESAMLDFESSMCKALSKVNAALPHPIEIHGCLFHFAQCIMKRIRRNFPLLVLYREKTTNKHFRHLVQSLWALAFLPVTQVIDTYVEIIRSSILEHPELFETV